MLITRSAYNWNNVLTPTEGPIAGWAYKRQGFGGKQGWRSGESARLPPVWPGFDSQTPRHMCVEFVVGSLLAPRGFSPGTPVFPSPQKPTFLNFNSIWNAHTRINEFLRALRCYVGK